MVNFFISPAYVWGIIAILFLLFEVGSPGLFFFIAFFCGSMGASFLSLFIGSYTIQTLFFFLMTAVALMVLHYCIVPRLNKHRPHERTNIYALQGKRGSVIQTIATNGY